HDVVQAPNGGRRGLKNKESLHHQTYRRLHFRGLKHGPSLGDRQSCFLTCKSFRLAIEVGYYRSEMPLIEIDSAIGDSFCDLRRRHPIPHEVCRRLTHKFLTLKIVDMPIVVRYEHL